MYNILYLLLINVYVFFSKLRVLITCKNVSFGKNFFFIRSNVKSNVYFNDNIRFIDSIIDEYSYVGPFSIINTASIGRYCSIGPGVIIGTGKHPIDKLSTSPHIYEFSGSKSSFLRVEIGHDVWIGANAIIFGGVKIGQGAIIGAGSVVTKNVMPYEVVCGVPARYLKMRFSDDKISQIIKSEWWNLSPLEVNNKFSCEDTGNGKG